MAGCCEHCDELLRSKREGISQLSEEVLTSEEGLAVWSWVMATSWTDEMCVPSDVSGLASICHYTNMTKSTKICLFTFCVQKVT